MTHRPYVNSYVSTVPMWFKNYYNGTQLIKPYYNPKIHTQILSPFQFFKPFIIITSYCSHHPVPEKKIQTIISFEILMVQIMINGGVDPFAQPIPAKTFWINLIACMAIHIINNRKQKENG